MPSNKSRISEDTNAPIRLVIADDHPLFRDALRLAVSHTVADGEVAEAASFDSLCATVEATPEIDLILLDLNMPGMHGLSGLLYLRSAYVAVPVVVVSANENPRVIKRALELGAAGYIPKSAAASEIRGALRALLAGEAWWPESFELSHIDDPGDTALVALLNRLTPQQSRVLMFLSDGLLNKQIAHAMLVSEATVKAHVSAILQKLGVDNRTQAVIVACQLATEIDGAMIDMPSQPIGNRPTPQ
jgi:DNA-binding NarL/FixJ family response regulator